jgi:hypothetical protein
MRRLAMSESHFPPRYPARLPGTFWGITAFFNPARYGSKRANFRRFRESLQSQGLPLAAVELVHDDAPLELEPGDAEILVQRRGGAALWQKERLLNIAIAHLPADCDKVVWLDADVLFQNRHWIADTAALLEQYAFVQPFSLAFRLSPGCASLMDGEAVTFTANAGAACCWSHRKGRFAGLPGFALAARRDIVRAHGLYDRMILGGGDRILMSAAMGIDPADSLWVDTYPASLVADARAWCDRVSAAAHGSLSYAEGNLLHLWHGSFADRRFGQRVRLLESFNVHEDIRLDREEVWSWSTDKPALHEGIRRYFLLRNEDAQPPSTSRSRWIAPLRKLLSRIRRKD